MENQSTLSDSEIQRLKEITSNGRENFPAGYRFIYDIIEEDEAVDSGTKFWFLQASSINKNDQSEMANLFIRSVTEFGLKLDGAPSQDLQAISNAIASKVISDVIKSKGVPSLTDLVKEDVSLAITDAGQTIGGWGGSFYYWDLPIGENGETIGQMILQRPEELEKFIAVNAAALDVVATRFRSEGESFRGLSAGEIFGEMFLTGVDAETPFWLKLEILGRAMGTSGGGSYLGDPDEISWDGATWRYRGDGKWIALPQGRNARPIERRASDAEREALNARRQYRLRHRDDAVFELSKSDRHGSDGVSHASSGQREDLADPTQIVARGARSGADRSMLEASVNNRTVGPRTIHDANQQVPRPPAAGFRRQGIPQPSPHDRYDPASPAFDLTAWIDRLYADHRARLRAEAPQPRNGEMRNEGRLLLTSAKALGEERSRRLTVPGVKKERPTHVQVLKALGTYYDGQAKRARNAEERMAVGKRFVAALSAARYVENERVREATWAEATRSDPLLAPKLADNLVTARKALDRFGDRELYHFLDDSGLANHPAVIRLFTRVGEATAEDRFIRSDVFSLAGVRPGV